MSSSILRLAITGALTAALVACGGSSPWSTSEPGELPEEMAEYEATFHSTALDYAAIKASQQSGTEPWASKFLGTPYLPVDVEYPVDVDGDPLQLLAQINFAEVPELEDYPTRGILQFFIAPGLSREHVWGMASDRGEPYDPRRYFESMKAQRYFRILYHPDVVEDPSRLHSEFPSFPDGYMPISDEARLSFERRTGYVTMDDYRFAKIFGADLWDFFDRFGDRRDAVLEAYGDVTRQDGLARIGGYGEFVQGDPRAIVPDEDWVVLLGIDSSGRGEEIEILWGDVGIANFLIERSALQNRDFSQVVYYWDNH